MVTLTGLWEQTEEVLEQLGGHEVGPGVFWVWFWFWF